MSIVIAFCLLVVSINADQVNRLIYASCAVTTATTTICASVRTHVLKASKCVCAYPCVHAVKQITSSALIKYFRVTSYLCQEVKLVANSLALSLFPALACVAQWSGLRPVFTHRPPVAFAVTA